MDKPNHALRAFKAWEVLTRVSQRGDDVTYGELAERIGIHVRPIRYVLGLIQDYCMEEGLPPLTILVVTKGRPVPSTGFIAWDPENLEEGRELVYNFDWVRLPNPFAYAADGTTNDELVASLLQHPSTGGTVYALVKVRGIAQILFRKALLEAYASHCAFCGMTFKEALEAAHIIQWSAATQKQKMAVTNGMLLCSTHHKLFDAGYLTLSPIYRILCKDPKGENGTYTAADCRLYLDLHGAGAFLPSDKRFWPSADALSHSHGRHDWGELH